MPIGINDIWRQTFGEGFGYSPSYMQSRFEQGRESIGQQYDVARRGATADLNQRGFNSARPMGRMLGQMGSEQSRAVINYKRGLEQESEQLGQQQKGMLFQARSGEEMAKQARAFELIRMAKQQGYDITKMEIQDKMTLHQMAVQNGYDKDLIQFQHDLNKPGFMDFLGNIIGIGVGAWAGGGFKGLGGAINQIGDWITPDRPNPPGYNSPHGGT